MRYVDEEHCPRTGYGCDHCGFLALKAVQEQLDPDLPGSFVEYVGDRAVTVLNEQWPSRPVDNNTEFPEITCLWRQHKAESVGRDTAEQYRQNNGEATSL